MVLVSKCERGVPITYSSAIYFSEVWPAFMFKMFHNKLLKEFKALIVPRRMPENGVGRELPLLNRRHVFLNRWLAVLLDMSYFVTSHAGATHNVSGPVRTLAYKLTLLQPLRYVTPPVAHRLFHLVTCQDSGAMFLGPLHHVM